MTRDNKKVESYSGKPYHTYIECYASDGEDRIFLLGGGGPKTNVIGNWDYREYRTWNIKDVNYFQIYEVSTNSWKIGPPLKEKYSGMGCEVSSVLTKRLYTFGGYNRYDANAPDERMKDTIQSIGLDLSIFNLKKKKGKNRTFFCALLTLHIHIDNFCF